MTSNAPAGWHAVPHHGAQLRYWDGQAWTAHVAPATGPAAQAGTTAVQHPAAHTPPRKRLSMGWIVGIVVGGLALAGGVFALLVGVAAPTVQHQQNRALEAATRADVHELGVEITAYKILSPSHPDVSFDGTHYIVSGEGEPDISIEATRGIELGEYVVDADTFCVSTVITGESGPEAWFSFSTETGLENGPCRD